MKSLSKILFLSIGITLFSNVLLAGSNMQFTFTLTNGMTETGRYPIVSPANARLESPDINAGSKSAVDREYYDFCGPEGYACNFLRHNAENLYRKDAIESSEKRLNDYRNSLKAELGKVSSKVEGLKQEIIRLTQESANPIPLSNPKIELANEQLRKDIENIKANISKVNSDDNISINKANWIVREFSENTLDRPINEEGLPYHNFTSAKNEHLRSLLASAQGDFVSLVHSDHKADDALWLSQYGDKLNEMGYPIQAMRAKEWSRTLSDYEENSGDIEKYRQLSLNREATDQFGLDIKADSFQNYETIRVANEMAASNTVMKNDYLHFHAKLAILSLIDHAKGPMERFANSLQTAWSIVDYPIGFSNGIIHGGFDLVKGIYIISSNLPESVEAISSAILNWDDTYYQILDAIAQTSLEQKNWTNEQRGEFYGKLTFELGLTLGAAKVIKTVADTVKFNKGIYASIGAGSKSFEKILDSARKFDVPATKISDFADSVRIFGGKADEFSEAAATLTKKMDFVFGKATGSTHNIQRSQDMLRQMERIGLPDNFASRTNIKENLVKAFRDPSSISQQLEGGRVMRESLLSGPQGHLKVESIWDQAKLITIKLKGGN